MLDTEKRNPNSMNIDKVSTAEMLKIIQEENFNAVKAVETALPSIEKAVDTVALALLNGGRLFYIGAGTSGRLGVIDAAECPPTFGVEQGQVVGIIAGGEKCMVRAAENEEDDAAAGVRDLKEYSFCEKDVVVGISASGGADYVVGALEYANSVGAVTVSLSSNYDSPMERVAKIAIVTPTGAEVVTGSTRMKSGTAQKMVLNMISTGAMIKTGKVYENMMINLKPTNQKLKGRVIRIVREIKNCDELTAVSLLKKNDWDIKRAVESI